MATEQAPEEADGDEELQRLWEQEWKKHGKDKGWTAAFAALAVTRSKECEKKEKEARPAARAIVKDLERLIALAAGIRKKIADIDDSRAKREADRTAPTGGLDNLLRAIGEALSPPNTPLEDFLKKSRAGLDHALGPIEGLSVSVKELQRSFEALPLTHANQKKGFAFRVQVYRSLEFTEKAIARLERTSIGAVHQALVRMRRAGYQDPSEDEE